MYDCIIISKLLFVRMYLSVSQMNMKTEKEGRQPSEENICYDIIDKKREGR